ncbi:uncharacterized protein LOC62_02G001903 [Vanrija pseudolonga]|uniref:Uncharacterized protein n=1 Tax=Vanrija pseudolonga TaxID=143232 RepID=A0AAF1BFP3_9TREE|nr:hypothetical protein LOC62_02G001903 [Vanrija pseudolonga]
MPADRMSAPLAAMSTNVGPQRTPRVTSKYRPKTTPYSKVAVAAETAANTTPRTTPRPAPACTRTPKSWGAKPIAAPSPFNDRASSPSADYFSCGDAPVLDFVPAPDFTLAEALDNTEQLTLSAPRRPRAVVEANGGGGGTADRRASRVSSWRRSVSVPASDDDDPSPACTDEWATQRASWAAERASLLSRLRRHEREREQYESVIAQMEGEVDRVRQHYECERVEAGRARAKERVKARRERERWAEERAELAGRLGRCKCRAGK